MNLSDLYFEHVLKACNTHLLSANKICLTYFSIDTNHSRFQSKVCIYNLLCLLSLWSFLSLLFFFPSLFLIFLGFVTLKPGPALASTTWSEVMQKNTVSSKKCNMARLKKRNNINNNNDKYDDGHDLHDSSSSWNHGATSSTSSPATHRHCKCLQHGLLTAFTEINGGCKHHETREC